MTSERFERHLNRYRLFLKLNKKDLRHTSLLRGFDWWMLVKTNTWTYLKHVKERSSILLYKLVNMKTDNVTKPFGLHNNKLLSKMCFFVLSFKDRRLLFIFWTPLYTHSHTHCNTVNWKKNSLIYGKVLINRIERKKTVCIVTPIVFNCCIYSVSFPQN